MFEDVSERWKRYLGLACTAWSPTDNRHNLGAEVSIRLRQLDLIIRKLKVAIEDNALLLSGTPEEQQ